MTPPSISVIIPAHNEAKILADTLQRNVEALGTHVKEIIIVDNASTDNTAEIAAQFSEVTIVQEPEKNLAMARHTGFEAAQGDILVFLDADTFVTKWWLDRLHKNFRNSKVVCLSGPYIYHDLPWYLRDLLIVGLLCTLYPFHLLVRPVVIGGNFAIRRETLMAMEGFNHKIKFYGDDSDIAKRARQHGRVKFDLRLAAKSSGRRFREQGYLKTTGLYFTNSLWVHFRGAPRHEEHQDFR